MQCSKLAVSRAWQSSAFPCQSPPGLAGKLLRGDAAQICRKQRPVPAALIFSRRIETRCYGPFKKANQRSERRYFWGVVPGTGLPGPGDVRHSKELPFQDSPRWKRMLGRAKRLACRKPGLRKPLSITNDAPDRSGEEGQVH